MARVLLVIGEEEVRGEIARLLERQGHEIVQSPGPPDCFDRIRDARPQILLAEESPQLLAESLRLAPALPVVLCLKTRSAERAVGYLKKGAFECVPPPWSGEALSSPLRRAQRVQGTRIGFAWRAAPKKRPTKLIAAAAAGVLAALAATALLVRSLRPPAEPEVLSRPLPYHHPAGAAWREGLWISDWFTQSLYRHGPGLEIATLYHLPEATPGPIAFAEGSLFVAAAGRRWLKAVPGDGLEAAGRFEAPGPKTVGLCYDGLYLWSVDGSDRKVRKHLLDDRLSVLEAFDYPGGSPAALACDARNLWSIDDATGELLRHDPRRADLLLEKAALNEYGGGVWRPTGLVHDGRWFWSVAERREGEGGRVFRHPDPWRG